jgi:thiamine-phosphate pyrophosphorylase
MLRYAITDRTLLRNKDQVPHPSAVSSQMGGMYNVEPLLNQAARLAALNVDYLQLREKHLPAADLVTLARAILTTLRDSPTKLLINSRADIAISIRAHGVHLTSAPGELTPAQVHTLYAHAGLPAPIISLSCHTLEEVSHTTHLPPDARPTLILFGPVFEKIVAADTHPGTGLELLASACRAAAPIPVLALGGITAENTPSCLASGATGIAAIRLFLGPVENPQGQQTISGQPDDLL